MTVRDSWVYSVFMEFIIYYLLSTSIRELIWIIKCTVSKHVTHTPNEKRYQYIYGNRNTIMTLGSFLSHRHGIWHA